MLAQALLEYGVLMSAAAGAQHATYAAGEWVLNLDSRTWTIVVAVVCFALLAWRHRPSRS